MSDRKAGGAPLAGIKILDLTNVLAGPFCCYQLALLGADVIKVETPGSGDLARQLGADPALNRAKMGASFLAQNAGKRSLTVNLKHPKGRDLLLRLAKGADALVESFRPGVMARLKVGPEILRAANPRLVYCAISGFGQTGPLRERPAYDQIVQGFSGAMSITGDGKTAPLRVGYPVSDTTAGVTAAMAVAAALVRAARTGAGAFIDCSMLESTIATEAWVVSNYLIAGQTPEPMGNENRTAAPSGAFRTGDGLINIAANKQEHFEAVARVAGAPELIDDPRFKDREDRKTNRYALKEILEYALAAKSAAEWEALLNDAEVPAGRVLSVPQALAEPQVVERGFLRRFERVAGVGRDIAVVNGGFRLAGEPPTELAPPPTLGQHSDEILGALGLDEGEIAALRKEGAI